MVGRRGNGLESGTFLAVGRCMLDASTAGAVQHGENQRGREEKGCVTVRVRRIGCESAGQECAPSGSPLPSHAHPVRALPPASSAGEPTLRGQGAGKEGLLPVVTSAMQPHRPLIPPSLRSRTPFPLDPITAAPPSGPPNPLAEEPRLGQVGTLPLPTQGHHCFVQSIPLLGLKTRRAGTNRGKRQNVCEQPVHSNHRKRALPARGLHPRAS